jgi:hypothetical protein
VTTELDNSLYNSMVTKTYNAQRKDRFADVLADYLFDDSVTAETIVDDLKSLLNGEIQWADEQLQKRLDLATQLGL